MNIERKKRNQHEKYIILIIFMYFSRKPLSNGLLCWKLMDAKGNTSLIQRNRRKNIYIGSYDSHQRRDFHVFFASRSYLFKGFYGLRKACHWYTIIELYFCKRTQYCCSIIAGGIPYLCCRGWGRYNLPLQW